MFNIHKRELMWGGRKLTLALESGLSAGPFLLEGGWFRYSMDRRAPLPGQSDPRFEGWYVQGAWTLTGEPRRYNIATATFDPPKVDKPFRLGAGGGRGVWELAARYSDLDLNYREGSRGTSPVASAVRGGEQKIVTLGVNWYPNQNVRISLMYDWINYDGDSIRPVVVNGRRIGHEDVLVLRAQIDF